MKKLLGISALTGAVLAAYLAPASADTKVCRAEEEEWCKGQQQHFAWTAYEKPSLNDTSSAATCNRYCGQPDGPNCSIAQTLNESGGARGHNLFTVICH